MRESICTWVLQTVNSRDLGFGIRAVTDLPGAMTYPLSVGEAATKRQTLIGREHLFRGFISYAWGCVLQAQPVRYNPIDKHYHFLGSSHHHHPGFAGLLLSAFDLTKHNSSWAKSTQRPCQLFPSSWTTTSSLKQVNALKVSLSHHPCTYFKFLWKPAYFSLLANAYIGNV